MIASQAARRWLVVGAGAAIVAIPIASWKLVQRHRAQQRLHAAETEIADLRAPAPPENPQVYSRAREQVRRIMTASPERLSPTAKIEPFDQESFARDPEAYLSAIVPARCFQVARPGTGAPVLDVGGPLRRRISWGEAAALSVRTVPHAPVTFTIFGGGYLTENGVASVSVRADERGLALAHYAAGPGITGDVTVIAGSPLASGTQRFFIRVEPAEKKL